MILDTVGAIVEKYGEIGLRFWLNIKNLYLVFQELAFLMLPFFISNV